MYRKDHKISNGLILALLVLFFPFALILLAIRFYLHRHYHHLKSRDFQFAGHCFAILFGFWGIAMYNVSKGEMFNPVSPLLVFGIPAVIFYILSSKWKKKMVLVYQAYYRVIVEQRNSSFERIAVLTGRNVENVTQDIKHMIRMGILTDVVFNEVLQRITLNSPDEEYEEEEYEEGEYEEDSEYESESGDAEVAASTVNGPISINCSGCGASSRLNPGEHKECEFCGNMLQYKV